MKPQRRPGSPRRARARDRLKGVLERHRNRLIRLHAWSLLTRLAPIAVPLTIRFTLHPVIAQRDLELPRGRVGPGGALGLLIVVILSVGVLEAISRYRSLALAASTGHALVADLRAMLFNHLLRLPVSFHEKRGTGRLLLRFIGDSDSLRTWLTRAGPQLFADGVLLGVLAATMLLLNWRLGLVVLAPLPLLAWGFVILRPKLRQLTRTSRQKQAAFVGHLQERFAEIRLIKLFDARGGVREPVYRLAGDISSLNASRDRIGALFGGLAQLGTATGIALVVVVGVPMAWRGSTGLGELIAFAWLALHLGISLRGIARTDSLRQKAIVSTERILALLARPAEPNRASTRPDFAARGSSIEFEEVISSLSPPLGGVAAEPLTLRISGTGVHLLDPGLEPSVIFDLVLGFRRPTGGRILVDDQDVDSVNVLSLRRAFGMVPENPRLFEGTVLDNLRTRDPGLRPEEICAALVHSGLFPSREEVRQWLCRKLTSGGRNLSLVESYRAALALIICSTPPFVLFEGAPAHPRSAADMATAIEFLEPRAMILIGGRCPELTASRGPPENSKFSDEQREDVTHGEARAPADWQGRIGMGT